MSQQQLVAPEFAEVERRLAVLEASQKAATTPEFEEFSFRKLMPNKADIPLVVAGIGAGSATAVSGFLQSKITQLATYKPEYVQVLAGWLLYKLGAGSGSIRQYLSAFGGGVVIGAIGSLAQSYGLTLGKLGIHGSPGEIPSSKSALTAYMRVPL